MKYGLFSTFMSPMASPSMLRDFAQQAEDIGLDSLWLGEHVVLFNEMEFPYPGSKDGRIPVPDGGGLLDTVATFGFLANCTTKLRLATGITLVPQRNPIYTAKEFATLDWLTGGRIDFGVGVGWCKEEVLACGYSWDDRGERCNEFLELIESLWTNDITNYEGKHITVKGCRLDPKPLQTPHVPMIIGGYSPAAMRRTARFGSGWYGFGLTPEAAKANIEKVTTAVNQAGRSMEGFRLVITPPYDFDESRIPEYEALGVTELVFHLGSQKPERVAQRMRYMEQLTA